MGIDTLHRTSDSSPRRPVIESSWRRSELSGVRPEDRTPTQVQDIAAADPLLDAARPVLDDAAARLADTDVSLLLVDHECRMVTRVAFGTTVERRLDAIGASPGVPFGEDVVGTTALGTPAETRGGIVVNSSEHYLDQFKSISCFGQPIIHPATRRLAGIICMSEIADRINPLAIPVVNGIVADIADRLLDRSRAHQRRVLDAFQRAAPRRDLAVAAIGDDLQLTNALAAELLSPTDIGAMRIVATDPALRATVLPLTLVSGAEVEVAVEPVPGACGAALFRFRPVSEPPPRRSAPPTAPSHTSVAITGEPGTGRSTHAAALAAEADSPPVIVDVADEIISGRRPDIPAFVGRARSMSTTLVIDGVDLLDAQAVALLGRVAVSSTPESPLIVVGGKEYGNGSSRDWAAKGTLLLGVKAVIVESFERIHRSNLIGMGLMPLQFKDGQTRRTLKLDGTETWDITGLEDGITQGMDVKATITRADGVSEDLTLLCRIDTLDEVDYYLHGGILHYVLRRMMAEGD